MTCKKLTTSTQEFTYLRLSLFRIVRDSKAPNVLLCPVSFYRHRPIQIACQWKVQNQIVDQCLTTFCMTPLHPHPSLPT